MNTNAQYIKSSLHSIAPYVGKIRPQLASALIREYSSKYNIIYDPFAGSGTIPLEAWINGRDTIATDLNKYAYVLTYAKLYPFLNKKEGLNRLSRINGIVKGESISIENVPEWVQEFFHKETLKEILIWTHQLNHKKDFFFLACLLGILHHQRPGFLSFPSSHGAPYLRLNKYPKEQYPEMYEYKNVYDKLRMKVQRAYSEIPELDDSVIRLVQNKNTLAFKDNSDKRITVISSPPYMKALTYARDNRLRLWFLGESEWKSLEQKVSPTKNEFKNLMTKCFNRWALMQRSGDYCILVVGDMIFDKKSAQTIPDLVCEIAENAGYKSVEMINDPINPKHKTVKKDSLIKSEKICVLKRGRDD
jgi:hypothetical protein